MIAVTERLTDSWFGRAFALPILGIGLIGFVGLRDPSHGGYPTCPFHSITGLWCPGCGSTRALYALAHFDIPRAASQNVLLVAVLPYLIWRWYDYMQRQRGMERKVKTWPQLPVVIGVVVVAFWVLRNLPYAPFHMLAPQ